MTLFRIWKRRIKFLVQRLTRRGWDDRDTWCLDHVIAEFTLPRLKRFKELNMGYPSSLTADQWDRVLDRMIRAFELLLREFEDNEDPHTWRRNTHSIEIGLRLFGLYFRSLWR